MYSIVVILAALVTIAVIALTVLLGVWTYRDAKSKGMNGVLWTAVVLLVPSFIGLIIYLIVRNENHKVTCSHCNADVSGKSRYCSNCGQPLVPVVDLSPEKESARSSQKKILIGIFSTLGGIVVMSIFMVAFLIIGGIHTAGNVLNGLTRGDTWNMVNGLIQQETWDALEDTLGDLDALLDEGEVQVSIEDDKLQIQGKDGKDLLSVDEDGDSVYINLDLKELRDLLDKYGIPYDDNLSEEEMEQMLREKLQEAWKGNKE
ncbi:MAG: hypothetical protein IJ801_10550 [Lachnospiraceae bacterium]|nr:hypothetical protein [Lachnospiraceae bacterium]